MKILVAGGSGYVGSHAVRELAACGHEVVIYDNLSTGHRWLSNGFHFIKGDIGDEPGVLRALEGVDAVMHFAASAYVGESFINPRKYFRNNVEQGLKFLDAILASPVRMLIFSSTCATYGIPARLPISEDSPQSPVNPYGASKLFFEHALAAYSNAHGLRYVALRYFNAAGAHPSNEIGECHDDETHLIPLALKAITGTKPSLQIFGAGLDTPDGTCVRDFVHVSDLGAGHVKALEYLANGGSSCCLNLGTGRGTSVLQVIEMVKRVTGHELTHNFSPSRPGDPPVLYADPSAAMKTLGWVPRFDLEEIVSSAWKWENRIAFSHLLPSPAPSDLIVKPGAAAWLTP